MKAKLQTTNIFTHNRILTCAVLSGTLRARRTIVIDWARVKILKDEVGDEDFKEIVPLFLDEVSDITEEIKTGLTNDQLAKALHSLKGSGLNLGFSQFSNLCDHGERLVGNGDASAVDIPAILTSFDVSRQEFLAGLQRGLPH